MNLSRSNLTGALDGRGPDARINGLLGPSESGKSWLALEAVRQVLPAAGRVVLLDFQDSVVGQFDSLGSGS